MKLKFKQIYLYKSKYSPKDFIIYPIPRITKLGQRASHSSFLSDRYRKLITKL